MKPSAVITLVVVLLAALGFFFYERSQRTAPIEDTLGTASAPQAGVPEGAHVITLTEDGFVPDELTINARETVAWRTETGELFWPASNLHPSHLIYPEFDPKQPIPPDQSWSFTFTKTGEWKYHDHLAPYFTGVITVIE